MVLVEIDKRKKVWEEKEAQAEREGRLTKKMIREREKEAKGALFGYCLSVPLTDLLYSCGEGSGYGRPTA